MRGFSVGVTLAVLLSATVITAQQPPRRGGLEQPAKGQTVILGTWAWDVETNKQGGREDADAWWEQVTEKKQFLVPQNGAGLVVLGKKAFDTITQTDLVALKYSDKKLPGDSLAPGTVVALRTRKGNFAKLKVVKYRALHDFSFPEAKLLDEKWRKFALNQPNEKNYHIEVEWVLYRVPATQQGGSGQPQGKPPSQLGNTPLLPKDTDITAEQPPRRGGAEQPPRWAVSAPALELELKRLSDLVDADDKAGRWQFEGGQVFQNGKRVGNYATVRRVVYKGTEEQNTAMLTTTIFFQGKKPPENMTLQGAHDFDSGGETGSVSAASVQYAAYVGRTFSSTYDKNAATMKVRIK